MKKTILTLIIGILLIGVNAFATGDACDAFIDSDNDGMPDSWEIQYGLDPNNPADAGYDNDSDGLTNLGEYWLGTDPTNPDTDGDGTNDGIDPCPTDPLDTCLPYWTDNPLETGITIIKAIHITELRNAINTLRNNNSLPPYSWTDPTLTQGSSVIKPEHMNELRTAIEEVTGPQVWTDDPIQPGVTIIKAVHIDEIRAAVEGAL